MSRCFYQHKMVKWKRSPADNCHIYFLCKHSKCRQKKITDQVNGNIAIALHVGLKPMSILLMSNLFPWLTVFNQAVSPSCWVTFPEDWHWLPRRHKQEVSQLAERTLTQFLFDSVQQNVISTLILSIISQRHTQQHPILSCCLSTHNTSSYDTAQSFTPSHTSCCEILYPSP